MFVCAHVSSDNKHVPIFKVFDLMLKSQTATLDPSLTLDDCNWKHWMREQKKLKAVVKKN